MESLLLRKGGVAGSEYLIDRKCPDRQICPVERRKFTQITRALVKWYEASARDLPWRRTTNPYAIWISEIMLQQTQVKTVIPYFERWIRALPTIP